MPKLSSRQVIKTLLPDSTAAALYCIRHPERATLAHTSNYDDTIVNANLAVKRWRRADFCCASSWQFFSECLFFHAVAMLRAFAQSGLFAWSQLLV